MTVQDIANFIAKKLADALKVDEQKIDHDIAFARYGVDSATAVEITAELSDLLHFEVEPTLLYEYPTIKELSQYLTEQSRLKS